MKRILIIFVMLACMLSGCSLMFSGSFDRLETQQVESELGFTFAIPADWQALSVEEDVFEQYRYAGPNGDITLQVFAEMGGMDYMPLEDMAAELSLDVQERVFDSNAAESPVETVLQNLDTLQVIQLQGYDPDGQQLIARLVLYSPYDAIRYHLVFLGTASYFAENDYVIDGIADSFLLTKTEEDIYKLVHELHQAEEE